MKNINICIFDFRLIVPLDVHASYNIFNRVTYLYCAVTVKVGSIVFILQWVVYNMIYFMSELCS